VGGPLNLGDARAQVREELADGRGVAHIGVGASVQLVREDRARRRFPAGRHGRGVVSGRRSAELVGWPAPRGEAGEEHCPSLLAGAIRGRMCPTAAVPSSQRKVRIETLESCKVHGRNEVWHQRGRSGARRRV
jgi:hypothetical protein